MTSLSFANTVAIVTTANIFPIYQYANLIDAISDNGAVGQNIDFLGRVAIKKCCSNSSYVVDRQWRSPLTTMSISCTIVAIGDQSTVDNGDPLAMFLVATVDNGEVFK